VSLFSDSSSIIVIDKHIFERFFRFLAWQLIIERVITYLSARCFEHNVSVNWCRKFAENFAIFEKKFRHDFHIFTPWFFRLALDIFDPAGEFWPSPSPLATRTFPSDVSSSITTESQSVHPPTFVVVDSGNVTLGGDVQVEKCTTPPYWRYHSQFAFVASAHLTQLGCRQLRSRAID